MLQKELQVNQESKVTIQRGKHNKENPYAMISKKMLRDPALSPRNKGVLCYLLSLPDNWVTHPRQVAEVLRISKNQIYSVLKELIICGYASKEDVKCAKGRFSSVCYSFFEEKLENPQVIKEKSTVSQKPYTENPCPENPYTDKGTLLNTYDKDNIQKQNITSLEVSQIKRQIDDDIASSESASLMSAFADVGEVNQSQPEVDKPKRIRAPSTFPTKTREVADQMINIAVRCNPVYRPPDNLEKFLQHVDVMVSKDKQDVDVLLRTFEWACADCEQRDNFKGWQSVVCTNKRKGKVSNPAEIFRGHFSTIYSQMNSQPKRKFAPSSNDARSLEKMNDWLKDSL